MKPFSRNDDLKKSDVQAYTILRNHILLIKRRRMVNPWRTNFGSHSGTPLRGHDKCPDSTFGSWQPNTQSFRFCSAPPPW